MTIHPTLGPAARPVRRYRAASAARLDRITMNQISSRRLGLLDLGARSRLVQAGAVAAGLLLLTVASWIEVPMLSGPMTKQNLALPLVGALSCWRLGALHVPPCAPWCAGGPIRRARRRGRAWKYG